MVEFLNAPTNALSVWSGMTRLDASAFLIMVDLIALGDVANRLDCTHRPVEWGAARV